MENSGAFFYQGIGTFLFCSAITVMMILCWHLSRAEELVKENLYESHIIEVSLME